MDRITRVKKERPFLLRHVEACSLISALAATATIRGDLAEVGVAFGASAKIISTFAPDRTLHLFDTLEGLPEPTRGIAKNTRRANTHVVWSPFSNTLSA